MAFLFPGEMYNRGRELYIINKSYHRGFNVYFSLIDECNKVFLEDNLPELLQYRIHVKRYLGFGYILSFIPNSNAYQARIALSNKLERPCQTLGNFILKRGNSENPFEDLVESSKLLRWASLSPIWKTLAMIFDGYNPNGIIENQKIPLKRLVFRLPIIRTIAYVGRRRKTHFRDDAAERLIQLIFNPFRFIYDLLDFTHSSLTRIVDVGVDRWEGSSWPRGIMKGVLALVFGTVKLPIIIAERILDIPYTIIRTAGKGLLSFFSNVKSLIQTYDKQLVTATVEEVRTVKELRREVKGRENINYSQNTKFSWESSTEYLTLSKQELYQNKDLARDQLVTMRMTTEKAGYFLTALTIFHDKSHKSRDEIVADVQEAIPQWNNGI